MAKAEKVTKVAALTSSRGTRVTVREDAVGKYKKLGYKPVRAEHPKPAEKKASAAKPAEK